MNAAVKMYCASRRSVSVSVEESVCNAIHIKKFLQILVLYCILLNFSDAHVLHFRFHSCLKV
jgi:hypothetical protein